MIDGIFIRVELAHVASSLDSLRMRRAVYNPVVGWWKKVADLPQAARVWRTDTGLRQPDTLGAVRFEIANHLGNVVAVVSDRKIAVDSLTPLAVQHFVADRLMLRDYYAFGMAMPGRSWAVDSGYRFGFNGKEKMLGLNGLDFGARVNDVRLGRWLSVDPKAEKYPFFSPYVAFGNNPIYYTDPGGETLTVAGKANQAMFISAIKEVFGEDACLFDFNDRDELVFNGDLSLFTGTKLTVASGLKFVIESNECTDLVFEKNSFTEKHGGEATLTIHDDPNRDYNTIFIDPIPIYSGSYKITVKERKEYYIGRMPGSLTFNYGDAEFDKNGKPLMSGQFGDHEHYKTIKFSDRRAPRIFHGLGHVIYNKSDEQSRVIDYDNAARSNMRVPSVTKKEKRKYGSTKPEEMRALDPSHKNK